ncbi:MAG TPA: hypothetical protein PLZ58_03620 [Candidatus Saccharibacteria bacterium]|nr:hypothetical protein [Candidatus Saccharibacteria bacterium]HRN97506.1 hypothetical protein [Candidatus Saccharibacteria bacterium]HRQ06837.1 hypothetical protein [Candidatus Saccharibacteria bacterium]HRQ98316.1 hypothetical protein [Candidatus Saccharibacteria bacterium]
MTLDEITEKLKQLEKDPTMHTKGMYSPTAVDYPGNVLPFSEIHLAYLRKNKLADPVQYIANLELKIKIR